VYPYPTTQQQQARHLVNIAQDSAWLDILANIMNFCAADAFKTQLVTPWHLGGIWLSGKTLL